MPFMQRTPASEGLDAIPRARVSSSALRVPFVSFVFRVARA